MGPYGDYLKTYYWKDPKHVMEITAISHLEKPIYQSILGDGKETALLLAISGEISLLKNLRLAFPSVQKVHLTPSS